MVEVVVAMVTWNSAAVVEGALASLDAGLEGLRWRLVVADNGSTDDTVDQVLRACPDAEVVVLGRNAGYAAGLNAVFRHATPSVGYLAMNPDARLEPGCAAELVAAAGPSVAVVVPRLVAPDGPVHPSQRREPTLTRALGEAVLGGRRAGRWARWGELVVDPHAYEADRSVDWATGAVMLLTTRGLVALGGWDESFFLYSEETDYCLRAKDAGWSVRYVPSATATHLGGESGTSPHLYRLLVTNRAALFARRHGRRSGWAFRVVLALNEVLRLHRPIHRAGLRALLRPGRVSRP